MKIFKNRKKSHTDLILCFVSICLVLLAPSTYSYEYCFLLHNLFVLTFVYNVYKHRKEGLLSFNLLFSVSYYCTSFIYPVFIYNTAERYFSMFSFSFNENNITYCTAVAYSAYCFLQLGMNNAAIKGMNNRFTNNSNISNLNNINQKLNVLSFLFMLLLIYFYVNGGTSYFSDQFIYSMSSNDVFMGYIVQFITPVAYAMLILSFLAPNKRSFSFVFATLLVLAYVVLILSTGSRTIPLSMIIIALFMYNDNIKKLNMIQIAILGLSFVAIMVLVGSLRGGGEVITMSKIAEGGSDALGKRSENIYSFANELIICNRNLYYLIETTETRGYTYGATLLGPFLGMIPFMQGVFTRVTGVPVYILNSATYNTFLSLGPYGEKGLGTHAVADIYICFGLIGLVLIFYLYGYYITKFKNSRYNIYQNVVYYILISNAIYACRASILNLRSIIWTLVVVYLVLHVFSDKRDVNNFKTQNL